MNIAQSKTKCIKDEENIWEQQPKMYVDLILFQHVLKKKRDSSTFQVNFIVVQIMLFSRKEFPAKAFLVTS